MKLAIAYTVFNGLELLPASIAAVYDQVDEIVLCYQTLSNRNQWSGEVETFMQRYKGKEKFTVVKYDTRPHTNVKEQERLKHQLMIDTCRTLGCTHFILAATDHFYKEAEVVWAKNYLAATGYKHSVTFTNMYTFYKHPTWQVDPIENYLMPFICSINTNIKAVGKADYPVYVDPSVRLVPCNSYYIFDESEVMLYHYSMFRKDIENKFRNAASPSWAECQKYLHEIINYDINVNPGVKYFGDRKIKIVEDWFNLNKLEAQWQSE